MKKICIFCGKITKKKTKEHIIPEWLIELTNQKNKILRFGPYYKFDKGNKLILDFNDFTFDSFVYPACNMCNSKFSKLEGNAKDVILRILSERPLSNKNFNLLLTWFDKIRIGLYIANLYDSNNFLGIQPKYYINQGVQTKDRMLLIYKINKRKNYLLFGGTGLPAFMHYPLSFFLIINNFGFLNICDDFLLAKSFGLPYPRKRFLLYDQNVEVVVPGTLNIKYPVIEIKYHEECTQIYQPILNTIFQEQIQKLCPENHYKQVFICRDSNYGKIFYKKPNSPIKVYRKDENKDWFTNKNNSLTEGNIMEYLTLISFKVQHHYLTKYGFEIAPDRSAIINEKFKIATKLNKAIIDHLESLDILKNLIL
ncbi:MAG: hypothetical protein KJI71_00430 [Patescibacteria group bacterium]|nr:hypothetical protein [Patescibacteria group bacterium]